MTARGDNADQAITEGDPGETMSRRAARLWRTVTHLRARQVLLRPTASLGLGPSIHLQPGELRKPLAPIVTGCAKRTEYRPPDHLLVLSEDVCLPAEGWMPDGLSALTGYNLHYFDWLFGPGDVSVDQQIELVRRWVERNPEGEGEGWDPYPTSLRLVNWVRWYLERGIVPEPAVQRSIAQQVAHLRARIEWHLMGNHVWANLKALISAGLYFDGQAADHLLRYAERTLVAELEEQVRADGGHGELSPMYQATLTEDLLDLCGLYRVYGLRTPKGIEQTSYRMLDWLARVTHPDGTYARFNDSAESGPAPPLAELLDYGEALGFDLSGLAALPPVVGASGYMRVRLGEATLLADCADIADPHLAGHAHADQLTFELSLGDQRLVVDTGVSTYEIGERRSLERSTIAHNTIQIDGVDSSEVWASFRTGRRGRVIERVVIAKRDLITIESGHDGYAYLPGSPIHRREWALRPEGLDILDTISGGGTHSLVLRIHLDPSISVEPTADGMVLTMSDGATVSVASSGWDSLSVERYRNAVSFGVLEDAACLVATKDSGLPFAGGIAIDWSGILKR